MEGKDEYAPLWCDSCEEKGRKTLLGMYDSYGGDGEYICVICYMEKKAERNEDGSYSKPVNRSAVIEAELMNITQIPNDWSKIVGND